MTNLERAQWIIDELSWKPNAGRRTFAVLIDALAAARLEGAEEMRERALEAARDGVRVAFDGRRDEEFIDENDVIGSIEDAFASTIPLTPEERGMTDLERARAMMRNFPPTLAEIAEALAAARREGAAEMRERAAQIVHENGFGETAAAIRALPLTPEEPV